VIRRALPLALAIAAIGAIAGCGASGPAAARLPDVELLAGDGPKRLADVVRPGRVTVILFFSAECHCQTAHDGRLRDLAEAYRDRGVDVIAVDSEITASPDRDAAEARARAYPFPIFSDPRGALADALGAEYATYAVVVDGRGAVRYRGGIDSDRSHLTPDASPWVRAALDRVLAGADPEPAETKTLGCSLRRR
jgi:peroxiredoxin